MTIDELLLEVSMKTILIRKNGDELILRGSETALQSEFLTELRAHKTALLDLIGDDNDGWWSPPAAIVPAMLSLVKLTQEEIDRIVTRVPGGAANVQDIYPLAPLQEGMLFHHLMSERGDAYLLEMMLGFEDRTWLEKFCTALQAVIDRHDILRTAVLWEGLSEAVQVVWRKAVLSLEEVELSSGANAVEQLHARFDPLQHRIDLRQAPLLRLAAAYDSENDRWLAVLLLHHLAGDHTTLEVIQQEVHAHLLGRMDELPIPLPFRNLVAEAQLGVSREEHETFFRKMLGDVDEPTAPFGLLDIHGNNGKIEEGYLLLDDHLAERLRANSRRLGVSVASLCHLAWARVLSKVSGREDVVFGTVLFGRMQGGEGADRVLGPFINTLPIRIQTGDENVETSVRRTHARLAELLRHEHASLVLAQRCSAVLPPTPLFSALLNYRHSPGVIHASSGESAQVWQGIEWIRGAEHTNYPLVLSVEDFGGALGLTVQAVTSINPLSICDLMRTALESLVDALETEPSRAVCRLEVLPYAERHRVLYEWNDTKARYPSDRCIHELFEERVARTPEAPAVLFGNTSLSYGELNRRSNRLAHHLRERGVEPDTRVAICVERGFEMIVAVLAVLKAGGAYVPLESAYPKDRLRFMLEDSTPVALLTQNHLLGLFEQIPDSLYVLDLSDDSPWQQKSELNPERALLTPRHLAYVIYTSGSTGAPKGVMVEHITVMRLFAATDEWFHFTSDDIWTLFHSYAFDFSVWEIWGALLFGGRLVVVSKEITQSPEDFYHLVCREGVTILNQTPGAFRQFSAARVKSKESHRLRNVIFGGDALDVSTLRSWYEQNPDQHTKLINMYGLTEATVHATFHPLGSEDLLRWGGSRIGGPISDLKIYILDGRREPVPAGVTGELHVGGAGVARGYLNRPGLTAERFLADPFSDEAGARLYRTGDLGCWLPDGSIEFQGRNDFQVKIRGFRIELGEIEARLVEQPGIREAVVVARDDVSGDKRLVAYYIASGDGGSFDAEQLRSQLSASLPEYMLPAAYIRIERLPLTPNGKLDRRALPVTDIDAYAKRGYEPPQGQMESQLAAVWAEVLKIDRVGRHDNFFDLGGHSISAMRLVQVASQRLSVAFTLQYLYTESTVAGMVRQSLASGGAAGERLSPISKADRSSEIPLSFSQQRLWFLSQLHAERALYNVSTVVSLKGALDRDALDQALTALVHRHEALRTVFRAPAGRPQQTILENVAVEVLTEDLTGIPESRQMQVAAQFAQREADQPFNLSDRPPIRFRLLKLDDQRHILVLTMHHIVTDGWSIGVLIRDTGVLYSSARTKTLVTLPELPVQYPDFAVWERSPQRHEYLDGLLRYWSDKLENIPVIALPTDLPRPAIQSARGASERVELGSDLSELVRRFSRAESVTPFMTLLAVYQLLLSRYSGQDDIAVGTPVAARERVELEAVVGLFVNTLVLRTRLSGDISVRQFLRHVRSVCLEAYRHQEMPFERLVEVLQSERDQSRNPLFQVMFALQDLSMPVSQDNLSGLDISTLDLAQPAAKFDMNMLLHGSDGDIGGVVEYPTDLFASATIRRFVTQYCSLLRAFCSSPEGRLSEMETVEEEERKEMLEGWNDSGRGFDRAGLIQEGIEEQAREQPRAVAVEYEGEQLSYGDLNERANRAAAVLRSMGVVAGSYVGIVMDRSAEMVVGALAVLKSGAAYVPMEPGYPGERRRKIAASVGLKCVLSQSWQAARLEEMEGVERVIWLDAGAVGGERWIEYGSAELAGESGANVKAEGSSEDLAYVIFTSGSTGEPKGVMVQHRPVVNLIEWVNREFGVNRQDRLLFVTSLCFDLSVYDMFGMLAAGGVVEVASQREVSEPDLLVEKLYGGEVSFWDSAPAALQQLTGLMDGRRAGQSRLRLVFLSGDWIPVSLPGQIREGFGPEVEVTGLGGATEATVWSNYFRIGEVKREWTSIPYGRPIQNSRYYVLDRNLNCCAVGVTGDLYIGGECLSVGYVNQARQTAERFIPDRYSGEVGGRLYRTGDQARYWGDGTLEFLGRADEQVKIRGYRVELGEVEAALRQHAGVGEAVVVADGERTGKRLVAYLVAGNGERASVEQLRAHVRERLPEYMVPAAYQWLETLPVTANGKLDRRALPSPDYGQSRTQQPRQLHSALEQLLAAVWADVLKVPQIGPDDNFFALGGHSLLAMELIARVHETLGVRVTLRDFFDSPTIGGLASLIQQKRRGGEMLPLQAVSRPQRVPLSFAQERLWFISQLDTARAVYAVPAGIRVHGLLDTTAVQLAIDAIVCRHETFRTSFHSESGVPYQWIAPSVTLPLAMHDCTDVPLRERASTARQFLARETADSFDIEVAPLARMHLLRFAEDDYALLFVIHHIVVDGWSVDLLMREFVTFYTALCEGRNPDIPELCIQYADYALWQREYAAGDEFRRDLDYWGATLNRSTPVTLPPDFPRTAGQIHSGTSQRIDLESDLSHQLLDLSRREQLTPFMTLLTGVAIVLHRYTGRSDIAIGTPIAGREQPELESLIGLFVNTLALQTRFGSTATIRECMNCVRETCLAAFDHAEVPFEMVVNRVQPDRNPDRNPLFLVMFVMNVRRSAANVLDSRVSIEPISVPVEAKFDLTFEFDETDGNVTGSLLFSPDLYTPETIADFIDRLKTVYKTMAHDPEQVVADIPFVDDQELGLLESWSTSAQI